MQHIYDNVENTDWLCIVCIATLKYAYTDVICAVIIIAVVDKGYI